METPDTTTFETSCGENTDVDVVTSEMNKLIADAGDRFGDIDIDQLSHDDKIKTLYERFYFYHNRIPNKIDDTSLVMRDILMKMIHQLQTLAKELKIENEVSLKITSCDDDPFNKLFRDHKTHRYEFNNNMDRAYQLYRQFEDLDEADMLTPHQYLFRHGDGLIDHLFPIFIAMLTKKGKKLITNYQNHLEKVFSLQFCKDYRELNDRLISEWERNTNEKPIKKKIVLKDTFRKSITTPDS